MPTGCAPARPAFIAILAGIRHWAKTPRRQAVGRVSFRATGVVWNPSLQGLSYTLQAGRAPSLLLALFFCIMMTGIIAQWLSASWARSATIGSTKRQGRQYLDAVGLSAWCYLSVSLEAIHLPGNALVTNADPKIFGVNRQRSPSLQSLANLEGVVPDIGTAQIAIAHFLGCGRFDQALGLH